MIIFKERGYSIEGIFFGLNSVEESLNNVYIRQSKGGHDLTVKDIKWNFNNCCSMLCECIELFDKITFYDAHNLLVSPIRVAVYRKGTIGIYQNNKQLPLWFNRFIKDHEKYSYKVVDVSDIL